MNALIFPFCDLKANTKSLFTLKFKNKEIIRANINEKARLCEKKKEKVKTIKSTKLAKSDENKNFAIKRYIPGKRVTSGMEQT